MNRSDLLADHGYLFLGTRLMRLAERMQADVHRVSQRAGVAIPPGKLPFLAVLSAWGALTVSELARAMGLSQPVTTRAIGRLMQLGLVSLDRSDTDGRSKFVSLTPSGKQAIDRSKETVWSQVEAAVRQVAEGASGSLLQQIDQMERAMTERSLAERAASMATRELVPASDQDVPAIVELMNRAYRGSDGGWTTEAGYISGDRTTEALLRTELARTPAASFLTWRHRDGGLKGCVWLEPIGNDCWYLGSLAVDPRRQQCGLGHLLLSSAERWARERGAKRVQMTVVNVRETLIAWYVRRGYERTGDTTPFPYDDHRFGIPQRDDLCFVVLAKNLN